MGSEAPPAFDEKCQTDVVLFWAVLFNMELHWRLCLAITTLSENPVV